MWWARRCHCGFTFYSVYFINKMQGWLWGLCIKWSASSVSVLFYPMTLEGRQGTKDGFAAIPFHPVLFSAALVELAKSVPIHSLILSSHLLFWSSFLLLRFLLCLVGSTKPEDLEEWPNRLSVRFLTRVRCSAYCPIAAWIFLQTSLLVTWWLHEMFNSLR